MGGLIQGHQERTRIDGVPLFVEELTKAALKSAGQSDQVAAVLGSASLRLFQKLQRGDSCTHWTARLSLSLAESSGIGRAAASSFAKLGAKGNHHRAPGGVMITNNALQLAEGFESGRSLA
jgi:hypothetical protein